MIIFQVAISGSDIVLFEQNRMVSDVMKLDGSKVFFHGSGTIQIDTVCIASGLLVIFWPVPDYWCLAPEWDDIASAELQRFKVLRRFDLPW